MRSVIFVMAFISSISLSAEQLAKNIDFRVNPAFLNFNFNSYGTTRLAKIFIEKSRAECPARRQLESASDNWQKLYDERLELEKKHGDKKISWEALQEKLAKIPRHVEIKTQLAEIDVEKNKFYQLLEPCENKLKESVYEDVDLFQEPEQKNKVAQFRIRVRRVEVRILPNTEWVEFMGDVTPAGESGYFCQTVLEKRGDMVLLPKNPFKTPVWFNYAKTFGFSSASEHGFGFVFPQSSSQPQSESAGQFFWLEGEEVLPLAIRGDEAVFRLKNIDQADEPMGVDEARQLLKEGKREKKVPLKSLFNSDQHLVLHHISC